MRVVGTGGSDFLPFPLPFPFPPLFDLGVTEGPVEVEHLEVLTLSSESSLMLERLEIGAVVWVSTSTRPN